MVSWYNTKTTEFLKVNPKMPHIFLETIVNVDQAIETVHLH